jgi:hypothetical protein
MERLGAAEGSPLSTAAESEEFGLDMHDLSLENIFVDSVDHAKIVSYFKDALLICSSALFWFGGRRV